MPTSPSGPMPVQPQPGPPVTPSIPLLSEKVDGIFEGGGALGAAYIGALKLLESHQIWFSRVSGTSAGAITAAMIALGFSASEMEWLCSSYPNHAPAPSSLTARGIQQPLVFSKFMDFPPVSDFDRQLRRKTMLWNLFKGAFIDQVGEWDLPVPTRKDMVDACFDSLIHLPLVGGAIQAAKDAVRDALSIALIGLPNKHLKVKDLALIDTVTLRENLADQMWDVVMRTDPLIYLMTTILHKGALFAGDRFYQELSALFGKKKHNNPRATVLFRDLQIPLAIMAADIDRGQVKVYSSHTHPDMVVMDAVRQSMSIPFVFEPQGPQRNLVDGGLFSNFPAWLYTRAGDPYWDPACIDDQRVKIGFSLNEHKGTPPTWNVAPGRHPIVGNPKRVSTFRVLKPLLIDKLVEAGYPRALTESKLANVLYDDIVPHPGNEPGFEILQEAVGVINGLKNTEDAMRKKTTTAIMAGMPYIDISIPLLGFAALDFHVNGSEQDLKNMFQRGWFATADAFAAAITVTNLPSHYQVSQNEKTHAPFA